MHVPDSWSQVSDHSLAFAADGPRARRICCASPIKACSNVA